MVDKNLKTSLFIPNLNGGGPAVVAHNVFVGVLVETGTVGFVLYMVILISLARRVWLMPKMERNLWFTVLAVWGVGAMSLSWELRKPTWIIFGLILTQSAALLTPKGIIATYKPQKPLCYLSHDVARYRERC